MAAQRLAHALGLHRPAAERDHRPLGPRQQLADHLFLARAKGGLALAVEELLDRLAQALLELAVGVERLHPQLGRERAGAGRLARTHESDENDHSVYDARLHPMRSS